MTGHRKYLLWVFSILGRLRPAAILCGSTTVHETAAGERLAQTVAAATIVMGIAGCARGSSLEKIGSAPPPDAHRIQVGATAQHVIWLEAQPRGQCLAFDGVVGQTYDGLWSGETISPNGLRYAYGAYRNLGSSIASSVVVDGKEEQVVGTLTKEPVFSADSGAVAFSTRPISSGSGQAWQVTVAGPTGRRMARATGGAFAISPDGKCLAYSGGDDSRHAVLVIEGSPPQRYTLPNRWEIKDLLFSPDGKRVACVIANSTQEAIMLDGVQGPVFHQAFAYEFSPDGSKFAEVGFDNFDQQVLCVNGVELAKYTAIHLPTFSADGKHMAFCARDSSRFPSEFLVVDGVAGSPHGKVQSPVISADGKHIAAILTDGSKSTVSCDGVGGPSFSSIHDLVLSGTGGRCAYATVSISKKPGSRMAMKCMVVDGAVQASYDSVDGPCFSADARHFAYLARQNGHSYLIVDGKLSDPFDSWLSNTIYFDPSGNAHCMGVKDGTLMRIASGTK